MDLFKFRKKVDLGKFFLIIKGNFLYWEDCIKKKFIFLVNIFLFLIFFFFLIIYLFSNISTKILIFIIKRLTLVLSIALLSLLFLTIIQKT